jgi:chromosome segregation ATPase
MLANQSLLIETMQAGHKHTEAVLSMLAQTLQAIGGQRSASDVAAECDSLRATIKDTDSMFTTLRDASTADLSQVLSDVKKYASEVVAVESRQLQDGMKKRTDASENEVNDRFKKLESRVLSELASSGGDPDAGGARLPGRAGDSQVLKKVTNRLNDFESQVTSQLQVMSQDVEKKLAFMGSSARAGDADRPAIGVDTLSHELDAVKYDVGELKDMINSAKGDTAHVKRIVLACERDMEDFTAAMDAVNVDLDEMRARVDSTHSIITSRQRVEATVTAEISTMRLDMGDMQEALKAHDAWMEDVSQSLQEAHERCHQLSEDLADNREQTQAKLDTKVDIVAWNDMNDDIDASIKTVRDMASALRLEVDSRRRMVDEAMKQTRSEIQQMDDKHETNSANLKRALDENHAANNTRIDERQEHNRSVDATLTQHQEVHAEVLRKLDTSANASETRISKLEADLRKQDEDLHKEVNDRVDGVERQHANVAKENSKRLNAVDLRISGLQGSCGEHKRDINKLRDETNSLTVKSAAHDVDIGKNSDDLRKLERQRAEDNQRHKQDMDAVYEELDQKVYEKNFQSLENNVTKLTRGTVKVCQVIGVFPGARMNDGTDEELDVDVELLNWEDCAQNLTARVEKTWRQLSSQKYKSVLDLVSKKADHSVLRLLQISQQHIESQLDRVRHERELWKEVVDKRAQQPLQLALTLKDPHTGQPLAGPGGPGGHPGMIPMGMGGMGMSGPFQSPRPMMVEGPPPSMGMPGMAGPAPPGVMGADQQSMQKASPLAKRIARPPTGGQPPPKA